MWLTQNWGKFGSASIHLQLAAEVKVQGHCSTSDFQFKANHPCRGPGCLEDGILTTSASPSCPSAGALIIHSCLSTQTPAMLATNPTHPAGPLPGTNPSSEAGQQLSPYPQMGIKGQSPLKCRILNANNRTGWHEPVVPAGR